MKKFNAKQIFGIALTLIVYIASIIIPIAEFLINHTTFTLAGIISILLEDFAIWLRKQYHREDEISKIFENATEKEKEEIYNFVKKYEKK